MERETEKGKYSKRKKEEGIRERESMKGKRMMFFFFNFISGILEYSFIHVILPLFTQP